jgi:hypothetical protein
MAVLLVAVALRHQAPPAAFTAWLAALLIPLIGMPGTTRPGRAWAAGLLAVFLLGATLRLYDINNMPVGFWIDEASTALNSLSNASTFDPFAWTPLLPWRRDWVQTSNLYLLFAWCCMALAGFGHLGVKLISVLPSLFTPVFVTVTANRIAGRPVALLAGGTFAASLWDVTISRWGWDEVLTTLLLTIAFGLLLGESRRRLFAAGVVCGLAQYTYASALVGFAGAAAFVLISAWARRIGRVDVAIFFAGFLIAAGPLLADVFSRPDRFLTRAGEVSILDRPDPLLTVMRSASEYALLFNVRGEEHPGRNFPGRAAMEVIPGLLFLAGLFVAVREWRMAHSQLLLVWLGSGLLLGLTTTPAPHMYRLAFLAPCCYLLAALGAKRVLDAARLGPTAVAWVVAVVVAVSAVTTSYTYFVERRRCSPCWSAHGEGARAHLAAGVVRPYLARGRAVAFDAHLSPHQQALSARHRPGASAGGEERARRPDPVHPQSGDHRRVARRVPAPRSHWINCARTCPSAPTSPPSSSSAPVPSSSVRRWSSTIRGPRPARRSGTRGTGSFW